MKHSHTPVRIYFAGKITRNCWRHRIVPGLRSAWGGVCLEPADPAAIDPILFQVGGVTIAHAGPYFVGCDHGCCHGPGSHGIVAIESARQQRLIQTNRQAAFSLCMKWLRSADAVFAHIESADAQGSLFELGWAHGRIPVFLNFVSEEVAAECWFAAQSASRLSVNPDAKDAFLNFLPAIAQCRERN